MIKKLVFLVGGTVAALALVNSVWSGSVRTAWKRAQAKIERSISPEFELARIRDEIAQLTPDMHKNIARIAEEMVQCESLDRRSTDLATKLDRSKDELAVFTKAIETGDIVKVSGRTLSPAQVKDKLRTCKNLERELANTQKILEAKRPASKRLGSNSSRCASRRINSKSWPPSTKRSGRRCNSNKPAAG